ncbi:MAG: hypothetical protein OEQ18_16865 [Gammaproteobacteria bacterium]|nr:hypothetical protein [Gammaproteobacteria bacterium]
MKRELIEPQSFAPEEFGALVELAIRAGQARAPSITNTAPVSEGPYAKAARVLRAHFRNEPERFESAMSRFAALMHLFTNGRLQRWSRTSAGGRDAQDIHPAVVHVAAQMKLNANGKFPERKFLAAVAQAADRIYAARGRPPAGQR